MHDACRTDQYDMRWGLSSKANCCVAISTVKGTRERQHAHVYGVCSRQAVMQSGCGAQGRQPTLAWVGSM